MYLAQSNSRNRCTYDCMYESVAAIAVIDWFILSLYDRNVTETLIISA